MHFTSSSKLLFLGLTCVTFVLCYVYYINDGGLLSANVMAVSEVMAWDRINSVPSQSVNMFHVILTFRIINSTEKEPGQVRMKEYIESLDTFLNHQYVMQVHLMFDTPEMPAYIQKHLGSHHKLLLHQVPSPDIVLTLHQFAFDHLQGQVVVITQADIILGEGFETINGSLLEKNRVMYSLSRHVNSKCKDQADRCKQYVGSHDTFVFVPKGEITREGKELLNHYVYSWGTERVVMRVYKTHLNYNILNPCWIFRVYHNHCSNYRHYTHKQPKYDDIIKDMSKPTNRIM